MAWQIVPTIVLTLGLVSTAWSQNTYSPTAKCFILELYVADDEIQSEWARTAAEAFAKQRSGIRLVTRSVTNNPSAQQRLDKIAGYYRFDAKSTPVIYGVGRVIRQGNSQAEFEQQLQRMFQMVVFTRVGCPKCAKAKDYLPLLKREFPGMEVKYRELTTDWNARNDLNQLVRQYSQAATSTPVFYYCNKLVVGFDRASTTGERLRRLLSRWAGDCPVPADSTTSNPGNSKESVHQSAREVATADPFCWPN